MKQDIINDGVVIIKNAEKSRKTSCVIKPASKLLIEILRVFQKEGYIGEFEVMEDRKGGAIRVELIKRINDCGIIKPRFSVKYDDMDEWEKRFLPAKDLGILILSTPKGIITHREAVETKNGGKLIAYVY